MAPRQGTGPRALLAVLVVALASVSSTAAAAPGDDASQDLLDPTADRPVPIIGGGPTASDEYVQVVAIVAGTGLCTGTLVAENLVLTAAHCLADLAPNTKVQVYYGDNVRQHPPVDAIQWAAHPDFCDLDHCKEDIHDYGYVMTAAKFKPPFSQPVATQDEWDATMKRGSAVTLVGFGVDPDVPGPDSLGIKRTVDTTITDFSPAGLEFYAGGDKKDSCAGDSGGPAFVTLPDGTTRLAGITSRGSDPCGKGGVYSAPFPALCWVRDATGVDLLGGKCKACDCVDISPEPAPDKKGCRIAAADDRGPGSVWALGLLGLLALVRRRRR